MSTARRPRPRALSEKDAIVVAEEAVVTQKAQNGVAARPRAGAALTPTASQTGAISLTSDDTPSATGNDDFFDRSRRMANKRAKTASFTQKTTSSRAGRSSGNADKAPVLSDLAQVQEDALGQAFHDGNTSDDDGGRLQGMSSSSDAEADDDEDDDDSLYDGGNAAKRKRLAAQARRTAYMQTMSRLDPSTSRQGSRSDNRPSGSRSIDRDGHSASATISPVDGTFSKRRFGSRQMSDGEDDDDDSYEPPEVDKEVIAQLKSVIAKGVPSSKEMLGDIDEDDAELDAEELEELQDIDPDLLRHLGGKTGQEARRIQRDALAKNRAEQQRRQDTIRRQQNQEQRQTRQSARESVSQRPPMPAGVAALRKSPGKGKGLATAPFELSSDTESDVSRTFARRPQSDRSSSPDFEIVSVNTTAPKASHAPNGSAIDVSSYDEPAPSTHAPPPPEEATTPAPQAAAFEDEVERIAIVMKGGEQGALVSHVQARPTTTVAKLVAHFVSQHQAAIPSSKRGNVKMRFDGDVLAATNTMEDIGIEDEEQLDVIW